MQPPVVRASGRTGARGARRGVRRDPKGHLSCELAPCQLRKPGKLCRDTAKDSLTTLGEPGWELRGCEGQGERYREREQYRRCRPCRTRCQHG